MTTTTQEQLVKILAEFQNDDGKTSTEGLRAVQRGNQLYEIRSIPMFAAGIHLFDIVRCREFPAEDHCPVMTEIVTPSGYSTIGIAFAESTLDEQQADIIWSLHEQVAQLYYERASKTHCAVAFPSGDYESICQRLEFYKHKDEIELFEVLD
jgi:hypothetical protein